MTPTKKNENITPIDECPDFACEWCFDAGKVVESNGDGDLCDECEFERSVCEADFLHDCMKEG